MGSRFLGNDEYAGPAEPGRDGFPFARERRSGGRGWVPVCTGTTVGQPGMGSRLHGNDGWGAGDGFPLHGNDGMPGMGQNDGWGGADGFPFARERRLGGRGWVPVSRERRVCGPSRAGAGWVPVCTGTTSMRAQQSRGGMGSRLHGNDGWGQPRMGSRCHGNDGRGGGNDGGGAGAGLGVWYTLGCGMGVPVCGFLGMYEVVRTAGWGLFRRGRCACRRSARGGGARG